MSSPTSTSVSPPAAAISGSLGEASASLPDPPAPHIPIQGTFDELSTLLRDTTFVVVDLETTGGSPAANHITEIGAVKVRGGEVLGEFQTLVNPGIPIPPFIAVLTGITNESVATAPRIESVLPTFLEFARGAVLVAHNAPFDIGFLRAACDATGRAWPEATVVDTALLARRALQRDEARDCRLSTLSRLFRSTTSPNHRALADARATVDVLHGLLERLGNEGVHTVEELRTWQGRVTPAQHRKRRLSEALPHAPGVYLFKDRHGRVLYVGKSKDLRSRVRTYFTASESRTRMRHMVALTQSLTGIETATELEAQVRELRLIAEHKPRFNRRSKFPERGQWIKLTVEPFPRLSIVKDVRRDGAAYLGPFRSRRTAEMAMTAVQDAIPIRQCTQRLSPTKHSSACVLAEMSRCGAPCQGGETVEQYAEHVDAVRTAFELDATRLTDRLRSRIERLSSTERFEEAAMARDRLAAFVRAAARTQRVAAIARLPHLVAARRREVGGWELHVVRYGRLAAADASPRGVDPRPLLEALVATAETVTEPPAPTPAAIFEEAELILRWLEEPGVRLVEVDGDWFSPAFGAGGMLRWLDTAYDGRVSSRPFDDRRGLRPSR